MPGRGFLLHHRAAADLFALPAAAKSRFARPPGKVGRGYFPFADRSLAYTLGAAAPPDLQEAWAMGATEIPDEAYYRTETADLFFAPNRWPEELPGFRETLTGYYAAMSDLAALLTEALAPALGLEAGFFADRTDRHGSVVRLIRYPAQQAAPLPDQLRAGAHTDYGMLTILRGDDVPGTLQVATQDGGWADLRPPQGAFVCNVGDALARWTGGRWRSTLHRVANPPAGATSGDRISLVFFHVPNYDAVLDGIGGGVEDAETAEPPVTFAEHFAAKIGRAAAMRLDIPDTGVADTGADA